MNNPFSVIDARLTNIESLLLDLKHRPPQPDETQKPPYLLTRKEVAAKLRITLVTVDKHTKAGILQSYRIGGQIRYKFNEIEKAFEVVKNAKYRRGN
jgi:excisionase family DNA binding protein